MEDQLSRFIMNPLFPCIMAKSVLKKGILKLSRYNNASDARAVLSELYDFVSDYQVNQEKLRSFVVVLNEVKGETFRNFEKRFWDFLLTLNQLDKQIFPPDPRVSTDPTHNQFCFSLMSEAFFILALHPLSPRVARRFPGPMVVFNIHQQFEKLRQRGLFKKIRNIIRQKDSELQGQDNSMLSDFGESSEIFQYLGKDYLRETDLSLEEDFICKLLNQEQVRVSG